MAELDKLTMLKADLNMLNPPPERVAMLEQLLEAAASRVAQRGITLEDTPGDAQLQVEYAAWMYRRAHPSGRGSNPGVPAAGPERPAGP